MCIDKVRRVLARLTVGGWAAVIPLAVLVATRPDHPARVLVILLGVAMVGASMLWVQVTLLGDYLRAYMMGLHDGMRGADPDPDPGTPARVVQLRRHAS